MPLPGQKLTDPSRLAHKNYRSAYRSRQLAFLPGRRGPIIDERTMADAVAAITASDRLLELAGRLERQEGFAEVVASLKAGHAATFDGVWGSSCALAAAALAAHAPGPLVVVCPRADDVDALVDDLGLFLHRWRRAVSGLRIAHRRSAAPGRGGRRPAAAAEDAAIARAAAAGGRPASRPSCSRCPIRGPGPADAVAACGPAAFAGGAGPLAGREPLSPHDGGGIAGRILGPRRHRRYLRPRLVRAGAGGVSATRSNRSAASRSPASGAWTASTAWT